MLKLLAVILALAALPIAANACTGHAARKASRHASAFVAAPVTQFVAPATQSVPKPMPAAVAPMIVRPVATAVHAAPVATTATRSVTRSRMKAAPVGFATPLRTICTGGICGR